MKMKAFCFVVATAVIGLSSRAHAETKANLCSEPVQAVCGDSKKNQTTKKILAREVADRAASETQQYFKSKTKLKAREFLKQLVEDLDSVKDLKSIEKGKAKETVSKAFAYLACLDYLSRGYFASNGDFSYLFLKCFTDAPKITFGTTWDAFTDLSQVSQQDKAIATYNEVKRLALQVIRESNYSNDLKPALIEQLEKTEYVSMSQFAQQIMAEFGEKVKINKSLSAKTVSVVASILTACDPTAFNENAFNYSSGKLNRMVICPSAWLAATGYEYPVISRPGTDRHLRVAVDATYVKPPVISIPEMEGVSDRIAVILAHELGHSVDSWLSTHARPSADANHSPSVRASAVANISGFQACMDKRHVKSGALVAEMMGQAMPDLSSRLFFQEYHADSVAANVMSLYLNRIPSFEGRAQVMKQNLRFFCDIKKHDPLQFGGPTSLHPSGLFRIETTFLSNVNLRKTLGCTSKPKVFACSYR